MMVARKEGRKEGRKERQPPEAPLGGYGIRIGVLRWGWDRMDFFLV